MKFLRWSLKLHKWIALIVGLQIFIWVGTGLYFSLFPIDEIKGNHKRVEWTIEPFDPGDMISLEEALEKAASDSVKNAELGHLLGEPVWRLTVPNSDENKVITVDAKSGDVLSPITESLAVEIAKTDYIGKGTFKSVEYLEKSPQEASAGGAPHWAAQFDDPENTVLYIDPNTAKITSSRSTKWRIFDFFWKLHIMDYDDGENFNHPLLIGAAIVAMMVVLSGFVLLFFRIRRRLALRKDRKNEMTQS